MGYNIKIEDEDSSGRVSRTLWREGRGSTQKVAVSGSLDEFGSALGLTAIAIALVVLTVDDATGIGVLNDFLIGPLAGLGARVGATVLGSPFATIISRFFSSGSAACAV